MSYLQLDIQALDRAALVASMAGLEELRLIGGLAHLWRHCWREKTAEVEGQWVVASFRVAPSAPEAATLLNALVAGEFIRPQPGGRWVVRGAEKRLGILKARQKAQAASAAKRAAKAPEAPQEPASAIPEPVAEPAPVSPGRVEQRRAPPLPMKSAADLSKRVFAALLVNKHGAANGVEQDGRGDVAGRNQAAASRTNETSGSHIGPEPAPPDAQVAHQGPAAGSDSKQRQPRAATDEAAAQNPHQAVIDRLCKSFERIRGSKYAFTGRDAKAVAELRTKGSPEEIIRRWEVALQTEGYKGATDVWEFNKKWNAYPPRAGEIPPTEPVVCTATDDEWQELTRIAAKELGVPSNWAQDLTAAGVGRRKDVEERAFEMWKAGQPKRAG